MYCSYKFLLNATVLLSLGALFYVLHNDNIFQTKSNSSFNLAPSVRGDYNLWCIFTKANNSYKLRQNLRRFAKSLVEISSVPLSIHLISDNASQVIADRVFEDLLPNAKTKFTVSNGLNSVAGTELCKQEDPGSNLVLPRLFSDESCKALVPAQPLIRYLTYIGPGKSNCRQHARYY